MARSNLSQHGLGATSWPHISLVQSASGGASDSANVCIAESVLSVAALVALVSQAFMREVTQLSSLGEKLLSVRLRISPFAFVAKRTWTSPFALASVASSCV